MKCCCSGTTLKRGGVRSLPDSSPGPLRAVPQAALPEGVAYEAFIADRSSVPTRENLHDFFNGLCWLRFPLTKQRLNQLQAAEIAMEEGINIEVIDLRSMSPIDFGTILSSVQRTGRLVVAHEASTFVSISSEIAAKIAELAFYHLEAPVLRVGGFDVPYPAAKLEEHFLPDADRILEAVDRVLAY